MACKYCQKNPAEANFCMKCGATIIKEEKTKSYVDYVLQPHDTLFKNVFGNRENVIDFLKNYLPKYILKLIKLETLKIIRETYISQELRKFFSDALYKVKLLEKDAYIYVLIEHKSYYEENLPFQLLEYMTQIWRREREEERKFKYPFILPLVIYHGERKERIRYLSEIVELPDERLKIYAVSYTHLTLPTN